MKRDSVWKIGVLLVTLLSSCQLFAVHQIVEFRIQTVNALEGIVLYGDDQPASDAQVAEFTPDWKTELRRITTDSQGRFVLEPVKGRKIYYLQVSESKFGMNSVRVPLRISKWQGHKPLRIRLNSPI